MEGNFEPTAPRGKVLARCFKGSEYAGIAVLLGTQAFLQSCCSCLFEWW
jgi:hypothetical protein